jgi:hypothetical protein
VSGVPDAPTSIPATIIAVLFSATPVAAADRPVNAFSSEITTPQDAGGPSDDSVALARGQRGTDVALLALLDRLGLTPAGRLRLQWLIAPRPVSSPVVEAAPRSDDPRLAG